MQMLSYLQPFHTYLRGVVPAIKPHLPDLYRDHLLSNHSATSLCSKTALDLCSCEFIWIYEKEPLVPYLVPYGSGVLYVLVPVCGSTIVRTAG
jgi:hypothetical protein